MWHPLHILECLCRWMQPLDLSHTQNIGRMIKSHFPYSQFIVVSLKEGMFNNANVIFRTKFVDGVSAVTRTVPDRRYASARLLVNGMPLLPYMHSCSASRLTAFFTGPAGVQSSPRAARKQLQHTQTELCLRKTSGIDPHQCTVANSLAVVVNVRLLF